MALRYYCTISQAAEKKLDNNLEPPAYWQIRQHELEMAGAQSRKKHAMMVFLTARYIRRRKQWKYLN
jgi:hypothetical protein